MRAGTPDRPHLSPIRRFAKRKTGKNSTRSVKNERPGPKRHRPFRTLNRGQAYCAGVPNRLGMSTFTPGPIDDETETRLM